MCSANRYTAAATLLLIVTVVENCCRPFSETPKLAVENDSAATPDKVLQRIRDWAAHTGLMLTVGFGL